MWNRKFTRRVVVFSALLGIVPVLPREAARGADQEGCLVCHRLELRVAAEGGCRYLRIGDSPGGVHEALYCSDCHPDARVMPHTARPGAAQCVGECHGASPASGPSHRRAAYGGLTESHRAPTAPGSACLACHAYADAMGDNAVVGARCVRCHAGEARAVRQGPHWRMASSSGACAGCHPAHRPGIPAGKPVVRCDGPGCHARSTPGMRAIADHRGSEASRRHWGRTLLFLGLVAAAGGFGWSIRAGGGVGGRPE